MPRARAGNQGSVARLRGAGLLVMNRGHKHRAGYGGNGAVTALPSLRLSYHTGNLESGPGSLKDSAALRGPVFWLAGCI